MAVATTGAIYKSLSFDGVESRNFGVYITGEAVYNAPARDVEMISIPGRNGTFALDKGRFENIEVSYPAGIFADNEADFASAVSDFRNYLCSRKGYCRLVDEYNPEECRMAIYKGGLEVSPAQLKAGEFTIVFDCKPQRWLMSGEAAIDITSGDTLLNPTMFDSSPLLEVTGYGDIGINGETITVDNESIGDIVIAEPLWVTGNSYEGVWERYINLNTSSLNNGDTITISSLASSVRYTVKNGYSRLSCSVSSTTNAFGECSENGTIKKISMKDLSFVYGTSSTVTGSVTFTQSYWPGQGATSTTTRTITLQAVYSTVTNTIRFVSDTVENTACFQQVQNPRNINSSAVIGNSTKPALLTPIYIDLDTGESYGYSSGSLISLNRVTTMPAKLLKLKSGTNTFTKSNTVTQLKVTPRWWKV